jgi:hypothetical protein
VTKRLSLDPFFDHLHAWLDAHRLPDRPEGSYVRCTRDAASRMVDSYSSADVAAICYSTGKLSLDPSTRDEWTSVLQSFQDPETGLYHAEPHHADHTTAYAIAALELFDARPKYRLAAYDSLKTRAGLESFLDSLDWVHIWSGAGHRGAGVASSFAITREVAKPWFDAYFDWLDREHDPQTGFLRRGVSNPRAGSAHADDVATLLPKMAGTFHFHFVYNHFHRPFPFPEAMIDSTLRLQLDSGTFASPSDFGFADLDAAFTLGRALRQCGHRFAEVMTALERLAAAAVAWANDPKWLESQPNLDNTHVMAGVVFCLAELQTLVPGLIESPMPMRSVLDRRPFV